VSDRFIPPFPPRGTGPVPVWRGFVGERARTAVYGWSNQAFEKWYIQRNVFGHRVHIVMRPDMVQHVLLDNASNYEKPKLVKKLLKPVIGSGLLSSDGELWRSQRKIVAASFAPPAVDALVPVFARIAYDAGGTWNAGTRDMAHEATRATMQVISRALFSGDPRLTSEEAMGHIAHALEGVSEARLQLLLGLPMIPLSPRGLRGRRGQIYLRRTLSMLVHERMRPGAPEDFVTSMIRALHERFPEKEAVDLAVDNAATFYLAGHETTANAISWTLFILSEQPEWQERASEEAAAALASGVDPRLPERVPVLRMIVDEVLRLYPSAPRFDREAVAEDRIGDIEVKAGDLVSIWPWLIHRHRKLWDDPDLFNPERFSTDRKEGCHRFQYIPFGAGPRTCVGARFALAEGLTILACWLAKWRFRPMPNRQVQVSGMVTLRPKGGLPLMIDRR
jgi:cytochrome P450